MENFVIKEDYRLSRFIVCSDTIENARVSLLKYLGNHGYFIHGMKKTAKGNSHDEDWQDNYTVVADGGPFADLFRAAEVQKPEPYVSSPDVEHIRYLTVSDMEAWSKTFSHYSGEERVRYVYVTDKEKKKYVYHVEIFLPDAIEDMSTGGCYIDWYRMLKMSFLEAERWEAE